jgi:Rho termination factor, N-terminal domain
VERLTGRQSEQAWRDPVASAQSRQRPGDNGASSARPTERASNPGTARPRSNLDARAEAEVPESPRSDAEKRADGASRETENMAGKSGDHAERKHAKPDPEAKAADSVDEVRRSRRTPWRLGAPKSKRELYREAKDAGIEGRSRMNKQQLVEALRKHRVRNSPGEPATRYAPGAQPPMGRQVSSKPQPPRRDVDSAQALGAAADAATPDRCTIVYKRSHLHGAFEVVVTDADGSLRSVARSPAFRARSSRLSRWRRSARLAHALLVWRLEACGWRSVNSGETWHGLRFVRARPARMRSMRSVVTLVREAGRARFVAEELDTYGNPTPLLVSAPFRANRFLPVRLSTRARAALRQLVTRMESDGWRVAAAVGKDWFAISLWRPASTNWRSLAPRSRSGRPPAEPR